MKRLIPWMMAMVPFSLLLQPTPADAKASFESSYGFERTWTAATRLVRVDLGFKITEKDESNGYLLFEYASAESGPKKSSGSFEFIRGSDSQAPVRVSVQLPAMPHYHEQVLMDELGRKLRAEYGDPPKREPARARESRDAGAD